MAWKTRWEEVRGSKGSELKEGLDILEAERAARIIELRNALVRSAQELLSPARSGRPNLKPPAAAAQIAQAYCTAQRTRTGITGGAFLRRRRTVDSWNRGVG